MNITGNVFLAKIIYDDKWVKTQINISMDVKLSLGRNYLERYFNDMKIWDSIPGFILSIFISLQL